MFIELLRFILGIQGIKVLHARKVHVAEVRRSKILVGKCASLLHMGMELKLLLRKVLTLTNLFRL